MITVRSAAVSVAVATAGALFVLSPSVPALPQSWQRAAAKKDSHLWNKAGGGTFTTSGKGRKLDRMQVCVSEFAKPDTCSTWHNWTY